MDARTQRIVETAMELAERDGYEAVRLRELAAKANVALGTVYRRFSSKEDILVAALQLEAAHLQERLGRTPVRGSTPEERVVAFFRVATRGLLRKPHLSRALLRTVSSGVPELTEKVAQFHGLITSMVVDALRGVDVRDGKPSAMEMRLAAVLQKVWFASLVGWAGGLHGERKIYDEMRFAARLLLSGAREQGELG